mmetsp:Transcript_70159/g.158673  ORF Transcript_70159/g.158673 Transcript_70159/m.158673 type:complete len:211 (-) Transcript_70159:83-715(-)
MVLLARPEARSSSPASNPPGTPSSSLSLSPVNLLPAPAFFLALAVSASALEPSKRSLMNRAMILLIDVVSTAPSSRRFLRPVTPWEWKAQLMSPQLIWCPRKSTLANSTGSFTPHRCRASVSSALGNPPSAEALRVASIPLAPLARLAPPPDPAPRGFLPASSPPSRGRSLSRTVGRRRWCSDKKKPAAPAPSAATCRWVWLKWEVRATW